MTDSIKKNAVFVNKFLKKELKGNPKQLYDAASHLILHGGKRLRPVSYTHLTLPTNREV